MQIGVLVINYHPHPGSPITVPALLAVHLFVGSAIAPSFQSDYFPNLSFSGSGNTLE